MRAVYLGVAFVVGLAGCEKPVEEMGYAERQALAGEIVQRCAKLGLKPDTPQMRDCTSTEAQKEIYSRRAGADRRSRSVSSAGDGLRQYGHSMQQQAMQNRPINCTHRPAVGWGSATTTCY